MEDWIMIDPKDFRDDTEQKTVRGVKINLFLSPYDIPQAVSGQYDKGQKTFIIKLKYLADEPTILDESEKHLQMRIGKNSKRVYEIMVDVDALDAKVIILEVMEAMEKIESDHSGKRSYDVVRKILQTRQDEIFAPLRMATS